MTYQTIDNFVAGLDTRKSPLTSPAGTLTRLVNAVITPGGEIQKRRAFVNVGNANPTFGMAATDNTLIFFGRNALPSPPTISFPDNPSFTTRTLQVPNSASDLVQSDFDSYDGKVYLACSQPSGSTAALKNPHYYASASPMATTEGAGKGLYVRVFQSKVYAVASAANPKLLSFSAIDNPLLWDSGTGHGFINLSTQDAGSEVLTALEVYYKSLAIFSNLSVQIWAVDPDPAQNRFDQLLRGTGTAGSRSPLQYGSGDVLYLDQSGIRSLKARDSSNSASVSDIGSPVDPTVQTLLRTKGSAFMSKAISLLEPSIGRFWMVFQDQILVLSYFPGPKITAWSQFTLPELGTAKVQHAATCGGRIFLRDTAGNIWLYGGIDADTYNACGVEVRLPYLDGKKPGHKKQFMGFDATVSGTWDAKISYNFNEPDMEEWLCTIDEPTWNAGRSEAVGYDSHFSLRFYNSDANLATISNCAVHYETADAEA